MPTDHKAPPPTADVNLTYPLALLVIIAATVYGIRERGVTSYAKGFIEPYPIMAPINVIEEFAKPVSLALRLFGNIFAGGVMLSIIGLLPVLADAAADRAVEAVRHVHRRSSRP